MQLNSDQKLVVDTDGHCRVVACPGSGKTRVITTKIGALIKRHPGCKICAVTFTRDAAEEIKHRTIAEVGEEVFRKSCRMGTFHSLAIRQLRDAGRQGKIAKPSEQYAYLRRAIALAEPSLSVEEATRIIETAKTSLSSCPEMETPFFIAYSELLKRNQVDDLYDVIRNSYTLMKSGEIKPYPVNFMLVDEFQDTDNIQMLWVLEHAKHGTSVTVVGDDDQSIYGWRGALGYPGMQDFVAKTKAVEVTLGVNYRCRAEILGAAEKLINCNSERVEKKLYALRGKGGRLSSLRYENRIDEARNLAEEILKTSVPIENASALFTHTVPSGSWAVLARNKKLLEEIEQALCVAKLRFRRAPGESIWNRQPFVFILSLLQSIQTGHRDGIDQAINHALTRTVGIQSAHNVLQKIHEQFPDKMHRILDGGFVDTKDFVAEEVTVIRDFCQLAPAWRSGARNGDFARTIRGVFYWFAKFEPGPSEESFVKTVGETLVNLRGSLSQRVNAITMELNQNSGAQAGGVCLYTIHGSKGLEFDNVWIVGTETTTIPSPKNANYEEERRLMYVAMTRAKDNLIVSSVVTEAPSPFVTEAGMDPRTLVTN